METYAVTLRPRGSYIGPITSQTLFGGVCWALEILRLVNVAELLAEFAHSPRFAFSSAFPLIRGPEGEARFFPKPFLAPISPQQIVDLATEGSGTEKGKRFKKEVKTITADAKQVKNATAVSQGLMAEIQTGKRDSLGMVRDWGIGVEKLGNALWLKQERQRIWDRVKQPSPLWKEAGVQRNSVDRVAGATAEGLLFQEMQTFLEPERAGLWFAARADAETWPWLEAAFRYLADTGLGGKRTVGKGHFDIEWERDDDLLTDVPEADSFITLSRYVPRFADGQMEAAARSYTLLNLRQKAENKLPGADRMRIYSGVVCPFAEGSVFALEERQPIYGCITPLSRINGRTVYYNGLALPLFAKLGGAV